MDRDMTKVWKIIPSIDMPDELDDESYDAWWILYSYSPPKRGPYCIKVPNTGNIFYSVNEKLLDWCKENNIKIDLDYNHKNGFHFIFDNSDNAVLFKLTWGGEAI
jgi:hypothetical protein